MQQAPPSRPHPSSQPWHEGSSLALAGRWLGVFLSASLSCSAGGSRCSCCPLANSPTPQAPGGKCCQEARKTNQGPTSDSSPEGPLADYRQAGMQYVLSECKLHKGGLGLPPGRAAAELGPRPHRWTLPLLLGPGSGLAAEQRLHRCPRRGPPEPARGRQLGGGRKVESQVPGSSLRQMLSGSVSNKLPEPTPTLVRASRTFLVFSVLVIFTGNVYCKAKRNS